MLSAAQIEALRSHSEQLLDPLTDFLIEDIAKRVSKAGQFTATASYDAWKLQQLGVSQRKLKKEIAKRLGVSQKEAEKLLTQAAKTGYNFDMSRFPTGHAIPLSANTSLQQILQATVEMAKDDLTNITQTIGFVGPDGQCRELTDAYNQACDFAFQNVSTGAQDYQSAIREATRNLAEKGIRTIDYESGIHTSIEAAVRRNIMGGLGLMQEKISESNHDALGCDGWEISAHAGSAPDHEPIQGKQFDDKTYKRINDSLLRRIGTLNCGHAAFPIIFGVSEPVYSEEELEEFRRQNEEGVTFEGRHYTLYEATQRQRKFERTIRKQKRRILVDESTGDEAKLQIDQIKLQRLKQEYARFSKGVGLPMQHTRMETAGFTWKHGKAAEKVAKASSKRQLSLRTPRYNGEKAVPYSVRGIEIEQRLKDVLVKLEKDADYVVAEAGTFKMQDLAVLTTETGVEFTVLTIGKESYLIRGFDRGTTIPRELIERLINEKGTFDYHSHPFIGDLRPSKEDKALLSMLTWQRESVIIDPSQSAMAFTVFGPKETVNVATGKNYSYWQELFGEGD